MTWKIWRRKGLAMLAIAGLSLTAGCQTGGFTKPDWSSLAFWKKDTTSTLPPPPARHFDPSDLNLDLTPPEQLAGDRMDASGNDSEWETGAEASDLRNKLPGDLAADKFRKSMSSVDPISSSNSSDFRPAPGSSAGSSSAVEDFAREFKQLEDSLRSSGDRMDQKLKELDERSTQLVGDMSGIAKDGMRQSKEMLDSAGRELARVPESARKIMEQPFPKLGGSGTRNALPGSTSMQSDQEVEELRRQMADAKRQIASMQNQLAQRASAPAADAGGSFQAPQDAPGLSPLQPVPTTPPPAATSKFPSTDFPKFSDNSTFKSSPTGIAPTGGFQAAEPNATKPAIAQEPVRPPSSVGNSGSKIPSYVESVDVPAAILTGDSSYAPGSVHRPQRR